MTMYGHNEGWKCTFSDKIRVGNYFLSISSKRTAHTHAVYAEAALPRGKSEMKKRGKWNENSGFSDTGKQRKHPNIQSGDAGFTAWILHGIWSKARERDHGTAVISERRARIPGSARYFMKKIAIIIHVIHINTWLFKASKILYKIFIFGLKTILWTESSLWAVNAGNHFFRRSIFPFFLFFLLLKDYFSLPSRKKSWFQKKCWK